ncbi:MAG: hypothetical protein KKH98_06910, partial [Spirochaetes bacterium]|nr:hypothetical protein [Spirochaetota bacterium]
EKIKKVFGDDDDLNFYAQLNYDLKPNPVKRQFYYAMWLANGVKSLLFNKFKGVCVPLKPQSVTYKDMGAKRDLILELNRLYPDLRETDPKKYNKFLEEMNKKLRIKTKIDDEDYDIMTLQEKKTGYHVLELFHNYLLDELLIAKKDYIITKNKDNNLFSVIFINNEETEKKIDLILFNLSKGVYQVTKFIYSNQLFSDKIDEPKVLEQYEVNIIKELKVNDKLLPLSMTILYFEIQNK